MRNKCTFFSKDGAVAPMSSLRIFSDREAVKSDIMSIRKACDTFKVPKITVLNRVNGSVINSGDGLKAFQRPALHKEVEQKIVDSSLKAAEIGLGISKQQLILKVSRFASR